MFHTEWLAKLFLVKPNGPSVMDSVLAGLKSLLCGYDFLENLPTL